MKPDPLYSAFWRCVQSFWRFFHTSSSLTLNYFIAVQAKAINFSWPFDSWSWKQLTHCKVSRCFLFLCLICRYTYLTMHTYYLIVAHVKAEIVRAYLPIEPYVFYVCKRYCNCVFNFNLVLYRWRAGSTRTAKFTRGCPNPTLLKRTVSFVVPGVTSNENTYQT